MTLLTQARSERSAHDGGRDARSHLQLEAASRSKGVPSRSFEELTDISTTRGMLEEHAARLAARNVTAKDVTALEKLADSLDSAVGARRVKDITALEREFHFTIYRASKGRHLLQLIDALWAFTAPYTSSLAQPAPHEWANERHVIRNIVLACRDRDENALGLMIRYKVRRDSARLLALLDRSESDGPASGVRARKAPQKEESQRKGPKKPNASARRSRGG